MKQLFFSLFIVTLISFTLTVTQTGCKKDTVYITDTITVTKNDTILKCISSIQGVWEGDYLTDQITHAPTYVAFTFYPDGSFLLKGEGVAPAQDFIYSTGKWILNNNLISFRDTTVYYTSPVIQEGSFQYDSAMNTLSNGVWHNVTSDNELIIPELISI
jgi:hypothetical protein